MFPPHGGLIYPPHSGPVYFPYSHNETIYPLYNEPIYPPLVESIQPPHGEPFKSLREESKSQLHDELSQPPQIESTLLPHDEQFNAHNIVKTSTPHVESNHLPKDEKINNSQDEIINPPQNEIINPSQDEIINPPQGEFIYPPHGESILLPHGEQVNPSHDEKIDPVQGESMHPPDDEKINPPQGEFMLPPHGKFMFPPHGEHIYPPHGKFMFPPHGELIYPPPEQFMFPPHGGSLQSPYGEPIYLSNSEQIYHTLGESIIPPHGGPIYPPHGELRNSSIGKNNNELNLPKPPIYGRPDFTPLNVENPLQYQNQIPIGIPINNLNKDIVLENEIKEKKLELNVNPEMIEGQENKNNNVPKVSQNINNEQNKLLLESVNINNQKQGLVYRQVLEYQSNLPINENAEMRNDFSSNLYYDYPYPPNIPNNRIKRHYNENNNTILEENEENNKPTLIFTEINKNQEQNKSLDNAKENNKENEKIEKNENANIPVENEKKNNEEEKEIINKEKEINNKDENKEENQINEDNKEIENKNEINNEKENDNKEKIENDNKEKIENDKKGDENENLEKDKEIKIEENQEIVESEPQDLNNINNIMWNNYEELPLYIDTEINQLLIDEDSVCLYPTKDENYIPNYNSFPIVLINGDKIYKKFIEFIDRYYKYREFNILPILKNKLILPLSSINDEQYEEYHFLKIMSISKVANITNSYECSIYDENEDNNIIANIKNHLNNGDINFNEFMDKWIHIVINLLVEFIQFKLKKISYYYYCNNCKFPYIYMSDSYIDEIYSENNNNNDLLIINNSINIYNDLMEVVNIYNYNNKNNRNKEDIINVIYYEEEIDYINYAFEDEINGTFIPCSSMKSFEKAMNEIHDRNLYKYDADSNININTIYNYMFELIIADVYIDKIFNYLINSNYFKFFKGICILIEEKENNNINSNNNNILLQIKKKYVNYIKDIYIAQNDIITFLKKAKDTTDYKNNKIYNTSCPVINYTNYLSKYYKLHQGASVYYNKYSVNSNKIIERIFLDFLISIDKVKYKSNNQYSLNKLKEILKKNIKSYKNKNENENTLFYILNLLSIIQERSYDKKDDDKINEELDIIIDKYKNEYNTFYSDFNNWLNDIDQLAHQKLCYFIGSLMYTLDNSSFYYNIDYNIDTNNDKLILYKELSGNDIDVLIHQKNKNHIITFPSFLLCSKNISNNPDDEDYSITKNKYTIIYRIKYNLNSMNEYIPILYELSEESKLYQLFTFYKIVDIKIRQNINTIFIDLEPINKKEYLELKLKENENEAIYYNNNLNIMESMYYENNNIDNSNINNNSNFSNSINQSNIYITSGVKVSRYLDFFNNKYGKSLNENMTSISLDNSNLRNIGLLILSKIKFKELIVLNLDKNNISDLTPLKECNFKKLKKLSLSSDDKTPLNNKIKDISPLASCKCPELFILNLKNNLISDITSLLFMNFPNLIILDLSYNKIESIHVFSNVNFPKLETLDLCNNLINDITPLITSSGKKNKLLKNIENNSLINSSSISSVFSNSQQSNEHPKKTYVLPSLKTLKIKHNKLNIDEGFLVVIKTLRNRGVTIFK